MVLKKGNTSLSLALSKRLEILPKSDESQFIIYAERVKPVDRKLSLEEAIEFMIVLEKTGYGDFFGNNFFFAEDGIYFIDTEYKDFDPSNPKWGAIESIKNLIEDPKDADTFMEAFTKRKADFDSEKTKREEKEAEMEQVFENPLKGLVSGYGCREFKFELKDL